jgi:hypothetical protein
MYKYQRENFMRRAKTKDQNNQNVILGLDDGQCYFVKDNSEMPEMIMPVKYQFMSGLLTLFKISFADVSNITLQPTALKIDSKQ